MSSYPVDRLIFAPDDVDLARSPLAGHLDAETYILGAFNPGLTRLPNGNLLAMVRIAEALREPIRDGRVHAIRWEAEGNPPAGHVAARGSGQYRLDAWPLDLADTADPRKFLLRGGGWRIMALTSLSWLLPVELSPDGLRIEEVHYDRAIAPTASFQCYGVEDARISRVGDQWLMTTCSVSPERHSTTLYTSSDGLDWRFADIVLDHQNKDMLIFEGLVGGQYWAQTRPLGDLYFAYPPGSEWRAGPSINLATSPDARHWKPWPAPGIRPHANTVATARIGGGTPPILTDRGWLSLWHGVEPKEIVGIYRTYWSILDRDDPSRTIATEHRPLLEASADLTRPIEHQLYVRDVVFTTGIADGDEGGSAPGHYIVASGEADLACRITHIPKQVFA
ncbi:glycosidase [Rhizorhabdus dicambivorans]|uniref:Glycosidase n=1 Tax=Rhizorhabdus dicambivorans TaxID=1850238 RepID=A0A2A4FTQ9_9SPHN|nr:glycosidase [Rhizorhabdus dicambivorans]ATE66422.1 glycosidase [Rhizorhabdus dicambivorans]PCE41086.1 glycosidase [Rhizorhabdus dicambivorans]